MQFSQLRRRKFITLLGGTAAHGKGARPDNPGNSPGTRRTATRVSMRAVRGRDASYLAPPAQNRTCGFPAYDGYSVIQELGISLRR